jgi:hypothetical protein
VTVSAGPSVPADLTEITVIEGRTASRHRIAWRLVAIESCRAIWSSVLPEAGVRIDCCNRHEENGTPLKAISLSVYTVTLLSQKAGVMIYGGHCGVFEVTSVRGVVFSMT